MKIALCDDESYILDELELLLKKYAKMSNDEFTILKFVSGIYLLDYMHESGNIDIIFLDIKMPGKDGLEVAHEIRKYDSRVKLIFLTLFGGLAKEGYKVDAVSYITKPITYVKLQQELKRVINKIEIEDKRYIVEKNDSGVYKLYLSEIIFIETERRNTLIHTVDKDLISYRSMKQHERLLDSDFYRCYRAYIVNIAYVHEVVGADIRLRNGTMIPLSRHEKKTFMEHLALYFGRRV